MAAAAKKANAAPEPTELTLRQELAFRISEQIFAGPYIDALMRDPAAARRVALRSREFVDVFLREVA